MKKTKIHLAYEITMLILALISVSFIWIESASFKWLDRVVWGIFVIDVSVRFFVSKNKWGYIKGNPFDLIAIIPFDSIFLLARLARLFRVVKALIIVFHFAKPFFNILKTNGLDKVLTFTFVLMFVSAIPIYFVEPNIHTFEDAIWWSIVTATTVGYGDMFPETLIGRMIAVVLMMVGIGLLGMVTGSLATYFVSNDDKDNEIEVEYVKNQLTILDSLSSKDVNKLIDILEKYRNKKIHKEELNG